MNIQTSKMLSHALRHAPEEYNITLDNNGWTNVNELVIALNKKDNINITISDIENIVNAPGKKRFELTNGKIRAYYGHSIAEKIEKSAVSPPEILFHGTQSANIESIKMKGLLPMSRQYVHLSADENTAALVAKRRAGEIVILKINSLEAYKSGIPFYREDNGIWLADAVPANYIVIPV